MYLLSSDRLITSSLSLENGFGVISLGVAKISYVPYKTSTDAENVGVVREAEVVE